MGSGLFVGSAATILSMSSTIGFSFNATSLKDAVVQPSSSERGRSYLYLASRGTRAEKPAASDGSTGLNRIVFETFGNFAVNDLVCESRCASNFWLGSLSSEKVSSGSLTLTR